MSKTRSRWISFVSKNTFANVVMIMMMIMILTKRYQEETKEKAI